MIMLLFVVNAWEACMLSSPNLAQCTRKGGLHLWGLDPLLVFNLSCPFSTCPVLP